MTKSEYDNLKLNDKVKSTVTGKIGIVEVLSKGEVYIQYENNHSKLFGYCLDDNPYCYNDIELV